MKKIKFLLLLAGILFLKNSIAQDASIPTDTSSIVVKKDPRLETLVKKQAAANAAYKRSTARTMRGYRLLVVNTNKRDEAIDAKTKVYTYFPELKAYLVYQSPYFKLKAGNFKTKVEAEKYRKNFNTIFPKGVFIVSETIEVKPEKESSGDN
jgi:hypothetical protein